MNQELWSDVDAYLVQTLAKEAADLEWVLATNAAAGLPAIDVSPAQGKLLQLLVRMSSAARVLEIGTLGGYSTIWMAQALPVAGLIITLEADSHHADVAQSNFERANLEHLIELREGPATDSLELLVSEGGDLFDLMFIDADKPNNPTYFEYCMDLTRPGGFVLFDNVIREGRIIDESSDDDRVLGVRSLFEMIRDDTRVSATAIQTVGAKGHDGFLLLRVNE